MGKKYADKLKDPRWQRKRLEILERDEWACRRCGSKDKTLHVHHKQYVNGRDPWEYPDHDLATLCDGCHADVHKLGKRADVVVIDESIQFWEYMSPTSLECPVCGGGFLHHGKVEVYNPTDEDAKDGFAVSIRGKGMDLLHAFEGNPSSRRNGIRIGLWCENCDIGSGGTWLDLLIAQHKGNTILTYEGSGSILREHYLRGCHRPRVPSIWPQPPSNSSWGRLSALISLDSGTK